MLFLVGARKLDSVRGGGERFQIILTSGVRLVKRGLSKEVWSGSFSAWWKERKLGPLFYCYNIMGIDCTCQDTLLASGCIWPL
mmetsp:Transcript_20076/g.43045  ORF Transcript_20076/g.43045 Transcript_20076/m.43045 type:complete len:83 (-) Transcript_20076:144-392(-)